MRHLSFDRRAYSVQQNKGLRAIASRAIAQQETRSNVAEFARLTVYLFPAALVFLSVLGIG